MTSKLGLVNIKYYANFMIFLLFFAQYYSTANAQMNCNLVFNQRSTVQDGLPTRAGRAMLDIKNIQKLIDTRKLHPDTLIVIEGLRKIRYDFVILINFPSIFQKLYQPELGLYRSQIIHPNFFDFALNVLKNEPKVSPLEVWNQYRALFRSQELTRALYLTQEQVNYITNNGLQSNFFRSGKGHQEALSQMLEEGIESMIRSHLDNKTVGNSPFMSASGDSEFAQWAGQFQRSKFNDPLKKLYLVKINIWKADLVYTNPSNMNEVLVYGDIKKEDILSFTEAVGEVQYRGRDY